MSHKYQHVKNLHDLNNELELAKVRKRILKEEIGKNLNTLKSNFSDGFGIFTGVSALLPFGLPFGIGKSKTASKVGLISKVFGLSTKIGGVMALFKMLKRKK